MSKEELIVVRCLKCDYAQTVDLEYYAGEEFCESCGERTSHYVDDEATEELE